MRHAASHLQALARVSVFLALSCVARGQGLPESDAVRLAHFAPHTVCQEGIDATRMGLTAVQVATLATGSPTPVTTGTVTVDALGISYAPDPPDRLVVSLPDGNRDFWFYDLQGTMTDIDSFLSRDHSLDFEVARAGALDVRFASVSLGGARQVTAVGTIEHDGVTYAIDLRNQGTYSAESDLTGGTIRDDNIWTGTVTAPDFALTVDESWSFFLIRAGQTVDTTDERVVRNVLEWAGSRYEWAGVRMRKSFRDGRPSQIDTYWLGTGAITRDGADFGQYGLQLPRIIIGPDGLPLALPLRFVLTLPNGETTLQSWTLP